MVLKVEQLESNRKISHEESEMIESLFKYPSLEKVFDRTDASRLAAMKRKMQATVDDLERVIRRGSKEDAAKAAKVVEAFRIALKFLDELETIRQASGQ
jgi:pantoate kinase